MLFYFLRGSPRAVWMQTSLMIAIIAVADWRVEAEIPLGFLYLLPILLAGGALRRWQIAFVAVLCTALTEAFDSFAWFPLRAGIPRDILIFTAFLSAGLFVYEMVRSREAARAAEEQLGFLVESSPAAILVMDSDGRVLLANDAAHRLLALPSGALTGRAIRDYLPSLTKVPALERSFRTVMQCRGRREDGEAFLADVWFSTYRTSAGARLAAMVADASEELRSREELSLHQLLVGSRLMVGAVSDEIRNVSGAIALVHHNLDRGGTLAGNQDFEALRTLIAALERISALDLRYAAGPPSGVDLASLLEELRIVVEPSLREAGIAIQWEIDSAIPVVRADRQSLMQIFLNLIKNSERAMLKQPQRELRVTARMNQLRVEVRVEDTGCGVSNPERVFHPFQENARPAELGLYLSRAFLRSFQGDLRYEPQALGSSFIADMSPLFPAVKDSDPRTPDLVARYG
jgi:two-component system, LuxR family, sensor kinase FixL